MFERAQIDFRDMFTQEVMTYESNIAYTLRFMIDTKVGATDTRRIFQELTKME